MKITEGLYNCLKVYSLCVLYPEGYEVKYIREEEFGSRHLYHRERIAAMLFRDYGGINAAPNEILRLLDKIDRVVLKHLDDFIYSAERSGNLPRSAACGWPKDIGKEHWWMWPDLVKSGKLVIDLDTGIVREKTLLGWKIHYLSDLTPYDITEERSIQSWGDIDWLDAIRVQPHWYSDKQIEVKSLEEAIAKELAFSG